MAEITTEVQDIRHLDHSNSRLEDTGDQDNPITSTREEDSLNFTDLGNSDSYVSDCELEYGGESAPFDIKGKRFSRYLQELRMEGNEKPFEKNMPTDFPVPDGLSIMEDRIAKIAEMKAKLESADQYKYSTTEADDESWTEQSELDMDPSLQAYLESDNNDIMSHPLYKRLCAAHISLCKLGATDAQLKEMEELSYELESKLPDGVESPPSNLELDKLMVLSMSMYKNEYCEFLEMHKKEFAKPFDEAMDFCKQIDEELVDCGLKFLRDNNSSTDQYLTNDTIARLQELPLEGIALQKSLFKGVSILRDDDNSPLVNRSIHSHQSHQGRHRIVGRTEC